MSDPVNSSDEAALRFTLVNAMVCYLAKGREPKMEDAPAAAVEATAAVDAFAAAVRAEAVAEHAADLQRRIEVSAQIENDRRLALAERDEYHRNWQEAERRTAEAVADERRRIAGAIEAARLPRTRDDGRDGFNRGLMSAADIARAAGSVPVATPPAEPAATVHDANCEQQLGACCCHCQKRADVAFSHAAPSQPVTCEPCAELGCSHSGIDDETGLCWCCGWRPGPVSVPKESSE